MRIYFSVSGDFDSADFVRATGLEPDEVLEKGSGAIRNGKGRMSTSCNFLIKTEDCSDLIPSYDDWLNRMSPAAELIGEYIRKNSLRAFLTFVLKLESNCEDSIPAVSFDDKVVRLLGVLNAEVNADIYLY